MYIQVYTLLPLQHLLHIQMGSVACCLFVYVCDVCVCVCVARRRWLQGWMDSHQTIWTVMWWLPQCVHSVRPTWNPQRLPFGCPRVASPSKTISLGGHASQRGRASQCQHFAPSAAVHMRPCLGLASPNNSGPGKHRHIPWALHGLWSDVWPVASSLTGNFNIFIMADMAVCHHGHPLGHDMGEMSLSAVHGKSWEGIGKHKCTAPHATMQLQFSH